MVVAVILGVVGLGLLTIAADHLVLGSSRVATRFRVSPVVVGVVVIGLGTSAPEFLVSGVAAARGEAGIALGNIVGSNILNLTLILGVAAMIGAIGVSSTVIRREVRLSVTATALFGIVAWFGLTVWSGLVLAGLALAALWLLLRWAGQGRNRVLAEATVEFTGAAAVVDAPIAASRVPPWFEPIRALLGLVGVLGGAQLLVVNASSIAERLGVSGVVIGFTLVALGTSVPELVTTIVAQRRRESELVVGNLFGSNLFNSLAGGAVVGFATGPSAPQRPALAVLVAMTLAAVVAWGLLRSGLRLSRVEGTLLLIVYLACLPLAFVG